MKWDKVPIENTKKEVFTISKIWWKDSCFNSQNGKCPITKSVLSLVLVFVLVASQCH